MPTPSLLIVPARFKSGKLYSQIPTSGAGDFTVTRATAGTRVNASGLIESVASGIPRLDYFASGGTVGCPALLVEPAATNLALHSRDLANAVWSGTNVTTAKNAVGADGVASGATTLTATAASGTVLQALSHASQSRVFSAYVRRVSGTGAIQMTTNGGTNWTTVSISSIYTQVACAAQTVASGTVGFRMAVSGDVIEVDFTQSEVGPVFTSPIPTTTASVTRNAEVISVSGAVSGSIGQTEGTMYAEVDLTSQSAIRTILTVSNNSTTNRIRIRRTGLVAADVERNVSGSANVSLTLSIPLSGIVKIAVGYSTAASGFVVYVNGSQAAVNASAINMFTNELIQVNVGTNFDGSAQLNDRIRAAALYTTRLTNAELAALTTP